MENVLIQKQKENGYAEFLIQSDYLRVKVSNVGCRILSIYVKERTDGWKDVILGQDDPEHPEEDSAYMGCLVGRVANRIRFGEFVLNGREYHLDCNGGQHHLHGGKDGLSTKQFQYQIIENGMRFTYVSPDQEAGYPGNLMLQVIYQVKGNTFTIHYEASADQDTLLNLSNHMYFNLGEEDSEIFDHNLKLKASRYMKVDDQCMVTGEVSSVENTVFDFRQSRKIGNLPVMEEEQSVLAKGYDHAFLLDEEEEQIILLNEKSGHSVTITTDMPMVHLYTGNYLFGAACGKMGKPYGDWTGIALETELCPDSIHLEKDPSVILRKGELYHSTTTYKFE